VQKVIVLMAEQSAWELQWVSEIHSPSTVEYSSRSHVDCLQKSGSCVKYLKENLSSFVFYRACSHVRTQIRCWNITASLTFPMSLSRTASATKLGIKQYLIL
jgi:hypothetical protein